MSPIGRIFIVLNLLLSAFFLGWASQVLSKGEDLRGQLSDLQGEYDAFKAEKEEELAKASSELNDAKDAAASLREDRDDEKSRAERAEASLADERANNQSLRADISAIQSEIANFTSTVDNVNDAKDRAVARASTAERERDEAQDAAQAAQRAQREAEDQLRQARDQIAALNETLSGHRDEIDSLNVRWESVLAAYPNIDPTAFVTVPDIDGAVLAVSGNLLTLNVGSAEGVTPGTVFYIHDGSLLKAEARVLRVRDGMSSAQLSNAKYDIRQGDRASTRL